MRKIILLSLLTLGCSVALLAQTAPKWTVPLHEVKYTDDQGKAASLKIDPGFQYADLKQDDVVVRFFFNKNRANISQARIVNQETNELIAEGKGSFSFGSAKMVFADGTVYKLQRKKNPNGYEIIGPHGSVFKVQNFGIEPVATLNEMDFLTQSFFVFDRVRATQQPPADINYVYYPTSLNSQWLALNKNSWPKQLLSISSGYLTTTKSWSWSIRQTLPASS